MLLGKSINKTGSKFRRRGNLNYKKHIDDIIQTKRGTIVIDGPSGVGKTYLVRSIKERYKNVAIFTDEELSNLCCEYWKKGKTIEGILELLREYKFVVIEDIDLWYRKSYIQAEFLSVIKRLKEDTRFIITGIDLKIKMKNFLSALDDINYIYVRRDKHMEVFFELYSKMCEQILEPLLNEVNNDSSYSNGSLDGFDAEEYSFALKLLKGCSKNPNNEKHVLEQVSSIYQELQTEYEKRYGNKYVFSLPNSDDEVKTRAHIAQIITKINSDEKKIPEYIIELFEINEEIQKKYPLDFSVPINEQITEKSKEILTILYSFLT